MTIEELSMNQNEVTGWKQNKTIFGYHVNHDIDFPYEIRRQHILRTIMHWYWTALKLVKFWRETGPGRLFGTRRTSHNHNDEHQGTAVFIPQGKVISESCSAQIGFARRRTFL